jgi:nicotinate-nucleotide adenylyltransferase
LGAVEIGVFGGTFNPIPRGHLHIAKNVQSMFGLSRVYFVVSPAPPHKQAEELIPFAHRYAMVSLAVEKEISFIPSMVEIEPEPSPYTIDTMDKLSRIEKQNRLFFIAGGDSLLEIASWRESERLLNEYNFIFVKRPWDGPIDAEKCLPADIFRRTRDLTGFGRAQTKKKIAGEPKEENRIYIVDTKAPDISSTKVRALSAAKGGRHAVRRILPPAVRSYIRKLRLYGVNCKGT